MGTTRLERKGKKNVARAKNRVKAIKRLNQKPSLKNIDIEEIKKEFAAKKSKPAAKAKKEAAAEAPAAE